MIAVISLDAVSRTLLDRMIQKERLPNCAELMRRGTTFVLKSTPVHASVYRSMYTGFGMSAHGVHYPLQWCPSEQRIKPETGMSQEDSVFTRLRLAGKRMLVIDPPECGPFDPGPGISLGGWQCGARFVLPQWCSSHGVWKTLKQEFGAPGNCHEVFGRPSRANLEKLSQVLRAAPGRLADATLSCLKDGTFDIVWITFVAAHLAGHQLWRETLDDDPGLPSTEPELVAQVYELVDAALGRILDALPPHCDILFVSPNGMGPETSRADLLPLMLKRVMGDTTANRLANPLSNSLTYLRATVPTRLRAFIADFLPAAVNLKFAARLESTGMDWETTQVFAVPSDGAGFVRLNLKGRERDGIVEPADAESLLERIEAGLATFVEPSGEKLVTAILRSSELDLPGPKSSSLPDLTVLWSTKPEVGLRSVTSPEFGEVKRTGVGSGRTGNHADGAWICVVPGTSGEPAKNLESVAVIDLPSTVCARLGVPHDDLPGRSILN